MPGQPMRGQSFDPSQMRPEIQQQQAQMQINFPKVKMQTHEFDQQILQYYHALNPYKANFAGIDIEMPRDKYQILQKFYEYHLTKQTPEEKLNFLEKTLLKRKSLIVVSTAGKKRQQKAALKRLKKNQKRG